jgi:hypothetical protein
VVGFFGQFQASRRLHDPISPGKLAQYPDPFFTPGLKKNVLKTVGIGQFFRMI